MKKISAFRLSSEEYGEIITKATNGKVQLAVVDGEWDYLCEPGYNYDKETIHKMVGVYLGITVSEVLIDISSDENVIII